MKSKLLVGLTEQERKEAKVHFKEALGFRKNLLRVLEKEVENLNAGLRVDTIYDKPGWQAHIADRLGQIKATNRLIEMLKENIL